MRPQRNLSWLRKSMRKTSPIYIPDQEDTRSFSSSIQPSSVTNDSLEYLTINHNVTVPNQSTSVTSETRENYDESMNAFENENQLKSQALHRDQDERESLNDSFNSFNTTVYYDADSCHNSIPSHTAHITSTTTLGSVPTPIHPELRQEDILNVLNQSDPDSPSRPRQLGRRSDPIMPRIVAIDVSSGNESRITSAPPSAMRQTTTPVCSRNNERHVSIQNRPQLAIPTSHITVTSHSVPSSLGTSRNASPVSLVSSTASSSITSATVDSHNQR